MLSVWYDKITFIKKLEYPCCLLEILMLRITILFLSSVCQFIKIIMARSIFICFFLFISVAAWPNCFWDRLECQLEQNCDCISWSEFVSASVIWDSSMTLLLYLICWEKTSWHHSCVSGLNPWILDKCMHTRGWQFSLSFISNVFYFA